MKKIISLLILIPILTIPLITEAGFFGGFLGGLLGNIGSNIIGGAVSNVINSIGQPIISEGVSTFPTDLWSETGGTEGVSTWPTDLWSETQGTAGGLPEVLRGPLENGIQQGIRTAVSGVVGQITGQEQEGQIWEETPYEPVTGLPTGMAGIIERGAAIDAQETAQNLIQQNWSNQLNQVLRSQPTGGQPSGTIIIDNPIKHKTFEELINAIIVFLRNLALVVTPLIFVFAGYQFVMSQGDPAKVKTAQQMMLWASVGLGLILIAEGIIELLRTMVSG